MGNMATQWMTKKKRTWQLTPVSSTLTRWTSRRRRKPATARFPALNWANLRTKPLKAPASEQVGMPTLEEQEKHRQFEEQRKKHYEMRDVKNLLGHPEDIEEEDEESIPPGMPSLPNRGVNGTR